MDKTEIIEKLRDDEQYYGDFGKKFLSNSDISALLYNPLEFKKPLKPSPALVIGGYFHTCILEPNKLDKYKIIESSSRNTKMYKELSEGDICLLEKEADEIQLMREKVLSVDLFKDLIQEGNIEYEKPGIIDLEGLLWKGKADIINHDERIIVDLKTTSDIDNFRYSASRYNYDSQAFIYRKLFGYDLLFITIDKQTHQIKICECSDAFYEKGREKVQEAVAQYKLFFKSPEFDPKQFFKTEIL